MASAADLQLLNTLPVCRCNREKKQWSKGPNGIRSVDLSYNAAKAISPRLPLISIKVTTCGHHSDALIATGIPGRLALSLLYGRPWRRVHVTRNHGYVAFRFSAQIPDAAPLLERRHVIGSRR